jgi:hypothetical protein
MKLKKQHFLRIMSAVVIVSAVAWLAIQWHEIFAAPPPWLNQVLMIMIDPALPISVQLRDSALNINR